MSEADYTRGPWKVDVDRRCGGYCITAPNGRDVASSVQRDEHPTLGQGISDTQALTNARLIAAAPELYQALEKACKETEHFQFEAWLVTESPSGDCEEVQRKWLESSDYKDFIDEWRDQLDALAKARGEA